MIVLDTCAVIWVTTAPAVVSRPAREAIEAADGLLIADTTLYELAWIVKRGRIKIAIPLDRFLEIIASRFRILPVTTHIARLAAELPAAYPSDPMDRLIGATALSHGVPLVTRDRAIRSSGAVPVIW